MKSGFKFSAVRTSVRDKSGAFESAQQASINDQIHLVVQRQHLTSVQPKNAAEKVVPELAD